MEPMYRIYPKKRYQRTLAILKKMAPQGQKILDLGIRNHLDLYPEQLQSFSVEMVTALEILEHLVNPFGVLQQLPAKKLLVTVPLRLWFAPAYRNQEDPRDCHYHEFEDWQLDMLLEKAGWQIKYREKWTHTTQKLGFRPLLRYFVPRYYAVYAEKKE